MRKIDFVICRYELILVLIILLLTGSVSLTSRDPLQAPARSPYSIVLTFDDGPHPGFTDHIVAVLRKEQVRATFFIVGTQAEKYPALVQELVMAGHEVAGHTFTHRNLTLLPDDLIRRELTDTGKLIYDITGRRTLLFRPPGGQYNERVQRIAETLGFEMVLWSVFPKDHEEEDPGIIVDKVLAQAQDGGIVLLHSGREPTLRALPRIIEQLKKKGYAFLTVSELKEAYPKKPLNEGQHYASTRY
jgi:peptidoglycan/xylan/chitin deacetylase (PgdA/CDA1 family)